ncbi:MAG: DUF72 domain-containing protein [Desulfobulbaceae bacterium]|nr:MAG: DUF72 domain-containing protein [Desulfobulbaceae bacterium]
METVRYETSEVCTFSAGQGAACRCLIGTSGYSYVEWIDSGFYPAGTKSSAMLALYGRHFSVVELNYTWYQMARVEPLRRMADAAPDHLLFAAKLTRTMTHERDHDWRDQLQQYRKGIAPLADKLLAVLVQLPPDFDRTINNRHFLAELLDRLAGLPIAVEFRHASWAVDSVFAELERRKVTLVTVDEPDIAGLFPCLDVVTNPELFYVRFHGRNKKGWLSGNMQKKFDYNYQQHELQQWCDKHLLQIARQATRGILFFNNHVGAQAPRNAQVLAQVIKQSASLRKS